MTMKRTWGAIGLVSLALILGACGPGATTETKNPEKKGDQADLIVWEDKDKKSGIEEAVKAFEKEENVTIKLMEKAYGNQLEDLRLDGPAGTGADVITIPSDQIGTAITEGLLHELTVDSDEQSKFTEAAMKSQIVDKKVYGLPKAVETQILFYNKELIGENELPKTTDEWLALSKKMTAEKSEQYGLLALWDQVYYAQGVMTPFGGYIFGEDKDGNYDPDQLGIDAEGEIKGADYIQTFYKENVFPSGLIGDQGINVLDSLFTEGKAAAVISGPWNLEPYKKAGIDYGVKELPLLPNGKHMSSFIGVKSYNVSSYSKNPELAEKFVKFITDEKNSKVRYEQTQEVPALKSLAEDKSVMENPSTVAIAEQSKYAELTPGITAMNSVWDPTNAALQTIATNKATPSDALKQAATQIKESIAATKN
ncbi:extracellular solute-binding protein [Enterococcus sulfureus]|nr:extracellular solute-binding protein [Enterococcus sulfureus]